MKEDKNNWIDIWRKNLEKLSGNLTTNEYMPNYLKQKLLEEDLSCKNRMVFEKISFSKLGGVLDDIRGLNILAGLQKKKKKDCLTVFRSIRFPTYKRINDMLTTLGCAIPNYEQERILELYRKKHTFLKEIA